jgi:hypothetical protein
MLNMTITKPAANLFLDTSSNYLQQTIWPLMQELSNWIAHSRSSLIGADPLKNWKDISNLPITRKDNQWYLHVLTGKVKEITLKSDTKPASA